MAAFETNRFKIPKTNPLVVLSWYIETLAHTHT